MLDSTSGDVTVGPRISIKATDVTFAADAGDVTVLDRVSIQAKNSANITISAGGKVALTKPKFRSNVVALIGGDVTILEKASFKTRQVEIVAASDVTIGRLTATAGAKPFILAPFRIDATNVTIGIEKNGRVPRSRITYNGEQPVEINASNAIVVENLVLKSETDVVIETSGTTAVLTTSKLIGAKTTPTVEVKGGPGSTCDFTGTVVKKATLVTSCDTVVGP